MLGQRRDRFNLKKEGVFCLYSEVVGLVLVALSDSAFFCWVKGVRLRLSESVD